jgi:NADPH:quinone reductase-like Zn-dependent oxidoreductase
MIRRPFPLALGVDFVGEVVAIGDAVASARVGERVWGAVDEKQFGAAAEYVLVTADHLAPAPANLTALDAASILIGGATALTGLRDKARLRAGERLLVRGAGGGVGSLAVQVGKALGAHVTALASRSQEDSLRELGADSVVDYRSTAPGDLGAFDVVFDTRGTDLRSFRRRLAPGGRMVAIAFDIDHPGRSLGYILASAVFGRSRVRFFRGKPSPALFADLRGMAERGEVRPVVHRIFPLRDMAAAHATLEAGGVLGKLVIDVADAAA